MTSLQKISKNIGNQKPVFSPSMSNCEIENKVETLNNLEGVEMGSFFYYSAASVLSDPNKIVAFLKMPPRAHLGWLTHLIGTPS